ncbi:hypothetical protein COLO4_00649, partial [Corchorus olitorius]
GLHRRHHRAIGKAEQKAQDAQLRGAGDKRHGNQQQQRGDHGRQQNTLGTDAIAEFAETRCGDECRHAGQRGNHTTEKRDILRIRRQLTHEQRQDRIHRAVTHLNHHGGDEQAEHQAWIIEAAHHLTPAQFVLLAHRRVAGLLNQKQRHQKADHQQYRGNDKHHAQAQPVGQQTANHRPEDHAANLSGRHAAQRPAAALTRHLRGHQRHGVGNITGRQSHQRAQQQQLPRLSDKRLQQNHRAHAKRSAQQHQLATFAIGKAAPQRRHGGRNNKGDTEGQA